MPAADLGAEEQGGGELRAFGNADAATGAGLRTAAVDRRGQFVVHRVDAVTEFAQCAEQRLLRSFVHPLDAEQPANARSKTSQRRQKPRCGAGVADKQLQRLFQRAAVGNLAAESLNRDGAVADFIRLALHFHSETESLQAIDHHLRVFAPECSP